MLATYQEICRGCGTLAIPSIEAQVLKSDEAAVPLTTLKVKDVPLLKGDVRALCELLQRNGGLTRLDVTSCDLDDEILGQFLSALIVSKSVTTLNLQQNTVAGTRSAVSRCLTEMPFLLNLNLSHNDLGKNTFGLLGGDLVWSGKRIDQPACQLQKLNLGHTNLPSPALLSLALGLRNNSTITNLCLSNNGINPACFKALALSLESNATIRILDVANNQCQSFGATSLARALVKNNTLEKLMLWDNDIGFQGLNDLFEALQVNQRLVHLDVGRNVMDMAAVDSLKNMVSKNVTIRTLGSACCGIGPAEAVTFAEGIAGNHGLRRLDLRSNSIGQGGLLAVARALGPGKNVTLIQLELDDEQTKSVGSGDSVVGDVMTGIRAALKENESTAVMDMPLPAPPADSDGDDTKQESSTMHQMSEGFSYLWGKMSTEGVGMAQTMIKKGMIQVERGVERGVGELDKRGFLPTSASTASTSGDRATASTPAAENAGVHAGPAYVPDDDDHARPEESEALTPPQPTGAEFNWVPAEDVNPSALPTVGAESAGGTGLEQLLGEDNPSPATQADSTRSKVLPDISVVAAPDASVSGQGSMATADLDDLLGLSTVMPAVSKSAPPATSAHMAEGTLTSTASTVDDVLDFLDGPTRDNLSPRSEIKSRPSSSTPSAISSALVDLGDQLSVGTSGDRSVEKTILEEPQFLTNHFQSAHEILKPTVASVAVKDEAQQALDDIFGSDDDF